MLPRSLHTDTYVTIGLAYFIIINPFPNRHYVSSGGWGARGGKLHALRVCVCPADFSFK